jgi:putative two-component system response regulator
MPVSQQRILIADDEQTIRFVLSQMLEREGLEVATASDGEAALALFEELRPDLVIVDIVMPRLSGFEVCRRIKADPENRLTPVIIVTSSSAAENRMKGLEAGADDFLAKPVDRLEMIARVRSLLRIKRYADELERAETVLFALARSIEGKDPYTEGHCERLSVYAAKLGRLLRFPEEEIVALRRAGIVHDIGKVAVPDAILLKPGPLEPEEWVVMRQHPIVGDRICKGLKSFRLVLPVIRHHHEKLNGTGYPDRLKGDAIPRTARALQIVDVFDALTTKRPYKAALSLDEALEVMRQEVAKGWWDPAHFAAFETLVKEEGFRTDEAAAEGLPSVAAGAD